MSQSARDVEAMIAEAVGLHRQGKMKEAVALYEAIVEADPARGDVLALYGTAIGKLGDYDRSSVLLSRAIEFVPDNAIYHNNLGIALQKLSRFAEAAEVFRRCVALDPRYALAFMNLGSTLYALGDREKSELAYRRAVTLQPNMAEAAMELGTLLFEQGQFDEAARFFHQSASADRREFGHGFACVIGEDYNKVADPSKLDELLARMPPLGGSFPTDSGDGRFILMTGCDKAYFSDYGRALALSVDRTAPGRRLHIHLFDPDEASHVELAELKAQLKTTSLTATWEICLDNQKSYFAMVRFIRMYQLLASSGNDVLCVDADTLINRNLDVIDEIVGTGDVAALTRPLAVHIANKFRADAVYVRHTPQGRRFLSRAATYLASSTLRGALYWWVDQCSFYITLRMMEFMGEDISMVSLPDTILDKSFRPESVIWTAGGRQKENPTFTDARDQMLLDAFPDREIVTHKPVHDYRRRK